MVYENLNQLLDRLETATRQAKQLDPLCAEFKALVKSLDELPKFESTRQAILEKAKRYGPAMRRAESLRSEYHDASLNIAVQQFFQCRDMAKQIERGLQWFNHDLCENDFTRFADSGMRKENIFAHLWAYLRTQCAVGDAPGAMQRCYETAMFRLEQLGRAKGRRSPEFAVVPPTDGDEVRVITNQPREE